MSVAAAGSSPYPPGNPRTKLSIIAQALRESQGHVVPLPKDLDLTRQEELCIPQLIGLYAAVGQSPPVSLSSKKSWSLICRGGRLYRQSADALQGKDELFERLVQYALHPNKPPLPKDVSFIEQYLIKDETGKGWAARLANLSTTPLSAASSAAAAAAQLEPAVANAKLERVVSLPHSALAASSAAAAAATAVLARRPVQPPSPAREATAITAKYDFLDADLSIASHICLDPSFATSDKLKEEYANAIEAILYRLDASYPQKSVNRLLSKHALYNKETILALHGLYGDLEQYSVCYKKYDIKTRSWVTDGSVRLGIFSDLVTAALFPHAGLGPQWNESEFKDKVISRPSKTREEWITVADSFPLSPLFPTPRVSAAAPNVEAIYGAAPLPQEKTFFEKVRDFFTAVWDVIADFFSKCFGKDGE